MRSAASQSIALLAVSAALAAVVRALADEPQSGSESDTEIEAFLRQAEVIEAEEIGSGSTRPLKLLLHYAGKKRQAAWKTVEVVKRKTRVKAGLSTHYMFTDDYHYERAAYVVDRELGLGMVPVVVLRSFEGQRGAAIDWVEDAITEQERLKWGLKPPAPLNLSRQQATMRIFDALILNTDRVFVNQLITQDDWRLHLIDHSRSFRLSQDLPAEFLERPVRLSHELLARLEALEAERLRELLRGVIGGSRIASLLARRDRILKKIEDDRRQLGDAFVFGVDAPGS